MCWVLLLSCDLVVVWWENWKLNWDVGRLFLEGVIWVVVWGELGFLMLVKFRWRVEEGCLVVEWWIWFGCIFLWGGLIVDDLGVVGMGWGEVRVVLRFVDVFFEGDLLCLVSELSLGEVLGLMNKLVIYWLYYSCDVKDYIFGVVLVSWVEWWCGGDMVKWWEFYK